VSRFFITLRAIDGAAYGGALATAPQYLNVPEGATPTPSHALDLPVWQSQVLATFRRVTGVNGKSVTQQGDLLFVVHGFNETIDGVAGLHDSVRLGLAEHGDNYRPTIVSFDWPSAGSPFAYMSDVDVAARTAIDLVNCAIRPFLSAQAPNCQVKLSAIAHSMGAFVLRAALGHADDGDFTGSDWTLRQLALVAGDVEASSFASGDKDTQSMMGHAYRLTNYFSHYDEALMISNAKRAGVEERVGRVGLPFGAPASTVNVNCSDRYAALPQPAPLDPIARAGFSHSWYFSDPNFFRDLSQTLQGAVDRNVIAKRTAAPEGGFVLAV
jgi:hypothetical protein